MFFKRFSEGFEPCECLSQPKLSRPYERVRAAEHAPRYPSSVLERRHGLTEVVERRAFVISRSRRNYALALYADPTATLDDLREAVTKLEDLAPTARRVLGGEHPIVSMIERGLEQARGVLRLRKMLRQGIRKPG